MTTEEILQLEKLLLKLVREIGHFAVAPEVVQDGVLISTYHPDGSPKKTVIAANLAGAIEKIKES